MADFGLVFERYYAGSCICSPARAALLTGRAPHRTGVTNQGVALRLQEQTVAKALANAGWRTAHFGKWHLDGIHSLGIGGGRQSSSHRAAPVHTTGDLPMRQTWLTLPRVVANLCIVDRSYYWQPQSPP